MSEKQKFYGFFSIGLLCAAIFLWVKMRLYDQLEYELDLFTILQLSRDYLFGKPFLYENAYGYNAAIHNYYLVPLCAPFTVLFGGKGLFVAGFVFMVWAWWLVSKLLSQVSVGKGVLFVLLFFSPTAFFLWDNFHFGWHTENFFYPLCVVLMASLLLKQKLSIWLSAIFLIINREDGVIHALAIFMMFRAIENKDGFWLSLKKLLPYIFAAIILFFAGLLLLQSISNGDSRINDTIERFLNNYDAHEVSFYLSDTSLNWVLLCGIIWLCALAIARKWLFFIWSLLAIVPIILSNIYSGLYYFPDPKYGINWAPRLAGIYGFLVAMFLLAVVSNKEKYNKLSYNIIFPLIGLFVCYIQTIGLERLHYYQQYTVLKRVNLAWSGTCPKESNKEVFGELEQLSNKIPNNYPVRMDLYLFAMFDHVDFIWPNINKHPYNEPKLLILSSQITEPATIPGDFIQYKQIGRYSIWMKKDDPLFSTF